jgi:hypothetical protein
MDNWDFTAEKVQSSHDKALNDSPKIRKGYFTFGATTVDLMYVVYLKNVKEIIKN